MKIFASTAVDPQLSQMCERALINEDFTAHAVQPGGNQIISFPHDGNVFVAILQIENVDGEGDALLITAVHPVGAEGLDAIVADLQAD